MISFIALFLVVAWIVVCLGLWLQFHSATYRRTILMWALGTPLLFGALLFACSPQTCFALSIVVGLCTAIAGPVAHLAFLTWPRGS